MHFQYNMAQTEQCLAKQLESSITTELLLQDLNNIEEHLPCSVYIGVFFAFFAAFALWGWDVAADWSLSFEVKNKCYIIIFTSWKIESLSSITESGIPPPMETLLVRFGGISAINAIFPKVFNVILHVKPLVKTTIQSPHRQL